jgi:hypothetical protein
MSEKSLAISCVAAAVVCGTFFYPEPPVAAGARAQPAPARTVAAAPATVQHAAPGKAALMSLDAPALADSAAKAVQAPGPATRDWANRIAVVNK